MDFAFVQALLATFAFYEGYKDGQAINDNIAIDHRKGFIHRALFATSSLLLAAGLDFIPFGWNLVPTIFFSACLFNILFRLALNAAREPQKPWWYLDDLDKGGNYYDEFAWQLYCGFIHFPRLGMFRRKAALKWFQNMSGQLGELYRTTKKVGHFIYLLEVLAAILFYYLVTLL